MKKIAYLLCSLLVLSLCSCTPVSEVQGSTPPETASTASAVPEATPTPKSDYFKAKEYLTELGYEVVNVKSSGTMVEFMITLDGLSGQDLSEPPEEWESIHDSIVSAASGLVEEDAGLASGNLVLYLQDNAGSNYLTITNGKETYSAFKTYSTDGFNPPTITMEEYNAIKTGMTFQEVYDIIGGAGEVISEVDLGLGEEYRTVIQQWEGVGSIGANANITFQGGKVSVKAQYGLE